MNVKIALNQGLALFIYLLVGLALVNSSHAASQPKITLTKAAWSAKSQQLIIKGWIRHAPDIAVVIYDLNGGKLGSVSSSPFSLSIPGDQLTDIPCAVRAQAGATEAVKPVAGNPKKACKQTPKCRILEPTGPITVNPNEAVSFKAQATLPKSAQPQFEWDFGGGSMGIDDSTNPKIDSFQRATGTEATVKFIRNDSRYRVRFSAVDGSVKAMESKQYRCEDSVEVTVGNPPAETPDLTAVLGAARQSPPRLEKDEQGNPSGHKDDLVVLPYEDLTMQCSEDMRQAPGAMLGSEFHYGSLNAVVYKKDLKSPALADNAVKLRYMAGVNPLDPVGPDSINSTSQNWPVGTDLRTAGVPMDAAKIRKTDRWDSTLLGPDVGENLDYVISRGSYDLVRTPDQGITVLAAQADFSPLPPSLWRPTWDDDPGFDGHGRRMPGFDEPYQANAPQDFTGFFTEQDAFQARFLPLTDIDDSGRVNPYPVLRVAGVDPPNHQPLLNASGSPVQTDAVQTAGTDFHCRGCHAKGKIGADTSNPWQASAYQYTTWNPNTNAWGGTKAGSEKFPEFFDPVNAQGDPSSDPADQERAAMANIINLHAFYDAPDLGAAGVNNGWNMTYIVCGRTCHSNNSSQMFGYSHWTYAPDLEAVTPPPTSNSMNYDWGYSLNMHRWHGELQYDDTKPGILRDERGIPKRWDLSKGYNVKTLFPVKNPTTGEILPMEQNCLKCHSGQREQCYRDRMYTAGVTCYQCHGDMLAVGQAYPKPQPASDGHRVRTDSFDQPDCGSCHTGSANVGKGDPEFFSAGVRKLAFAPTDLSATTLPVDWSNPDASRFAVPPTPVEIVVSSSPFDAKVASGAGSVNTIRRIDGPLFRLGKDVHGKVPCAACHGGAHAVWPNRDPSANDNVTALQLQGHDGQLLECNVCHSAEAFSAEDNNGSKVHYPDGDGNPTILAGPHNLHPINDPNWYKNENSSRAIPNKDGTTYGGWHNSFAKKPGLAGEDQCAACHGNDHKGSRLSRTPVDRVFDFRNFTWAKLKRAHFKKAVVRVSAGSAIGCDTCHNIKLSCTDSPAKDACGTASAKTTAATNQPPAFSAEPGSAATTFLFGQTEAYSYTPQVTDPDGNAAGLTFALSTRLDTMSIDPQTGQVTVSDWAPITGGSNSLPYTYTYLITVRDANGGVASQRVPVTIRCQGELVWGYDLTSGSATCLNNAKPSLVLPPWPSATVGQALTVTFTSSDADRNRDLLVQIPNYFLSDQPDGMILGQFNGALHWTPATAGDIQFGVEVTDQAGGDDTQTVTLHVCAATNTWSETSAACVPNHAPAIQSPAPSTFHAGTPFQYDIQVTDADGDPLQYTLVQAPEGMVLDGTTLKWTPTDAQVSAGIADVAISVTDGSKGGIATQQLTLHLCDPGQTWDSGMNMCM